MATKKYIPGTYWEHKKTGAIARILNRETSQVDLEVLKGQLHPMNEQYFTMGDTAYVIYMYSVASMGRLFNQLDDKTVKVLYGER